MSAVVLLVEDDALLAKALRRTLARYCELDHAPSNAHALELLRSRSYVAILSDWDLRDGRGIAALEHSRECLPSARRVLYTAHLISDIEPKLPLGLVDAIFEKPCDPLKLARALGVA